MLNTGNITPLFTGKVDRLIIDGKFQSTIEFGLLGLLSGGPYAGRDRAIAHHDGMHKARGLPKDTMVANDRMWTMVSQEDRKAIAQALGISAVPAGCLFETIAVSGFQGLSRQVPAGSHIYFRKPDATEPTCVLRVCAQNNPCSKPLERLQATCADASDITPADFTKASLMHRGLYGDVFRTGKVTVGQVVDVYGPIVVA